MENINWQRMSVYEEISQLKAKVSKLNALNAGLMADMDELTRQSMQERYSLENELKYCKAALDKSDARNAVLQRKLDEYKQGKQN